VEKNFDNSFVYLDNSNTFADLFQVGKDKQYSGRENIDIQLQNNII